MLADPAAERAVLAGICTYGGDAYLDVSDLLTASSFTVDSNQNLWACLSSIFAETPNVSVDYPMILTTANALGFSSFFEKNEEQAHLRAIMNFPVKLENVRGFAGIVKKLEVARKGERCLRLALEKMGELTGVEPIDTIVSTVEQPIIEWTTELTSNSSEGPTAIGQGVRDYAQYLADNQRPFVGIPSGFPTYDKAIGGGFRPGTVNVIGARTKVGKTFFANNVAIRLAGGIGYGTKFWGNPTVPVLQLDTEMTKEDQWIRQLAAVSNVPMSAIETGDFSNSPQTKKAVEKGIDILEKMPYDFLSIAGQPFEETVGVMRRWVTKKVGLDDNGLAKPCLIIFDYLKLMDSATLTSSKLAEFQVLGFMMTQLHNFAVRYKVPILTFVQLNRDGIDTEDASVVSQSDRIVWLCSNLCLFKAKSDEEIAEQIAQGNKDAFNRKIVPIVTRHGAGLESGDYINFNLQGAVGKLTEGPTKKQAAKLGTQQPQGMVVNDDIKPGEVSL